MLLFCAQPRLRVHGSVQRRCHDLVRRRRVGRLQRCGGGGGTGAPGAVITAVLLGVNGAMCAALAVQFSKALRNAVVRRKIGVVVHMPSSHDNAVPGASDATAALPELGVTDPPGPLLQPPAAASQPPAAALQPPAAGRHHPYQPPPPPPPTPFTAVPTCRQHFMHEHFNANFYSG
jgi:hypothetical protein